MIGKKMLKQLNKQINAEAYSGYLYLAMSTRAAALDLAGTAKWFFVQGQEEMTHAWRIFNYIDSQGARPELEAIDKPPSDFKSMKHMFDEALKHEKKITAMINALVSLARDEKDHATEIFLQWYVNEQVEEEKNVMDILSHLALAGAHPGGLYMVDKELLSRAFVMPTDLIAV